VTITRITDFPFEFPDADTVLQFEVSGFGVRTGDRRIVIDPWMAFDQRRCDPDGVERWQRISDELTTADLAPGDVDTVLFTHLDGVGWSVGPDGATPNFLNARHLIPSGELDAFDAGKRAGTEALAVLRDHALVDPIEVPLDVAPGVKLEPAVGHTVHNTAVRVTDDGGEALFIGHLFLHPAQVHRYDRVVGDEDPEALLVTRRALLDDAAARGTVLYGDLWDSPGCGTVRKDGDAYELI
jgi:hypothetical protein